MPRTFGHAVVHVSHLDTMVHVDTELPVIRPHVLTDVEKRIGRMIAMDLVSDGATLQMGQSHFFKESRFLWSIFF